MREEREAGEELEPHDGSGLPEYLRSRLLRVKLCRTPRWQLSRRAQIVAE